MAIKHGKPMPPTEQFADHFLVALTRDGEQALVAAQPGIPAEQLSKTRD